MKVLLQNPNTGQAKNVKIGFSWTVFFWGWIPAACRQDWKWTLIIFLAGSATLSISTIVLAFLYNKIYIQDLIDTKGYRPIDEPTRVALQAANIFVPSN